MRLASAIVAALLVLGLAAPGQAASLQLSPVGLDIPSTQRAATIAITNTDTAPVALQIRAFKWVQVNGQDELTPTDDIDVSPPAVTIPAGAAYTIRVVRPAVGPVSGELSYRLFIDEIPKPVDPRVVSQGVTMVLRTSMPIFVVDKASIAKLSWKLWQDADHHVHLQATNSGSRHVRLGSLAIKTPGGQAMLYNDGLAGYVLPGSTKTFIFPSSTSDKAKVPMLAVGSTVVVTAKTNALDISDPVVISAE